MKYPFLRFMIPLSLAIFWLPSAQSEVIFQDNFDSYTGAITGWNYVGTNVTLQTSGCISNSKCAKVAYTGKGTAPYTLSKDVSSRNLSEVYVKFNFKVDNPAGGSKFLKLFGKGLDPEGYANSTFGLDYDSNKLSRVS